MSVGKILALSVVAWVALGGVSRADAWKVWLLSNRVVENEMPFTSDVSSGDTLSFGSNLSVGSNGTSVQTAPVASPPPTPAPPSPAVSASAMTLVVPSGAQPVASTSGSGSPADAYLNFSGPSYPELSSLTTGNAQPWYDSPIVQKVFGGIPTLTQQTDFINKVFQDIQTTYQSSGINASLTLDPNVPAAHTLSVVSGVHYDPIPGAIGITDVGRNGFSFIDNFSSAQPGQVDQLEWAVAHNISHELMHAFGVAVHHDQTGTFLDAGSANWALLTSPNTMFSPAAVADINAHLNGTASQSGTGAEQIDGDQMLVQPVPEPATIALWGLGAAAVAYLSRRRAA
jgi:hypothetical protein